MPIRVQNELLSTLQTASETRTAASDRIILRNLERLRRGGGYQVGDKILTFTTESQPEVLEVMGSSWGGPESVAVRSINAMDGRASVQVFPLPESELDAFARGPRQDLTAGLLAISQLLKTERLEANEQFTRLYTLFKAQGRPMDEVFAECRRRGIEIPTLTQIEHLFSEAVRQFFYDPHPNYQGLMTTLQEVAKQVAAGWDDPKRERFLKTNPENVFAFTMTALTKIAHTEEGIYIPIYLPAQGDVS